MRNRDLNVTTIVRSDVLTERLVHALATGNWVGGRTGVSQLLDRTDYIATLSHLRGSFRLCQEHNRILRQGICIQRSGEGSAPRNTGRSKLRTCEKFCAVSRISTAAGNELQIKKMLLEMGTVPIIPQLIGMEEVPTTYATELEALEEAEETKVMPEEEADSFE